MQRSVQSRRVGSGHLDPPRKQGELPSALAHVSRSDLVIQLTGYQVPEVTHLVRCMLHPSFEARPTAKEVLGMFNAIATKY